MATKETIIKNAKKYIGKPYVWGGESMTEGGYDCSGYVYNVLKDSGIKVARQTAQGYSSLGSEVTYKEAIESDLLFFGKSKKSITHIAIYAGDGKMFESRGTSKNTKSNPGKGVCLSDVSRRKDLVLVKRVCSNAAGYPKYKLSGTMYYRNGPGVSYNPLGCVHSGDIIEIEKKSAGNWGYIVGKGWISLNTQYTKEVK